MSQSRRAAPRGVRRDPGRGADPMQTSRRCLSELAPAARTLVDRLEPRRLLSVATDDAGWTLVTPEAGAHVIYVSSSDGDDADDGRSPESAVRTLGAGVSLLRDDRGDQLLLERGNVWRESFGAFGLSGKSADQPIVIGAYGEGPRPRLETGATTGIVLPAGADVSHVAILGIHFQADFRDPDSTRFRRSAAVPDISGIRVEGGTADVLIEDCAVESYMTNLRLNAMDDPEPIRNVTLRRSSILDAYSITGEHSQGLYADGVHGLRLEENLFDHNGWSEGVDGAVASRFNHNVYFTTASSGLLARGNVFARGGNYGLQARAGGDILDNAFIDNGTGLSFGLVRGERSPRPGGVWGTVNGNVFLGTRNVDGLQRGVGLEVANTKPGANTIISNNIFAHASNDIAGNDEDGDNVGERDFPAIDLTYSDDPTGTTGVGLNDLLVSGNVVYAWSGGIKVNEHVKPGGVGPTALNGLAVVGNDFQQVAHRILLSHNAEHDPAAERWSGNRYDGRRAESPSRAWVAHRWAPTPIASWTALHEEGSRATRVSYADAARDLARYSEAIGGTGTSAAFLAEARRQANGNYRSEYAAAALIQYVRDGFAESSAPAPRNWSPPDRLTASPALAAPRAPTASAVGASPVRVTTREAALTFTVTYSDDDAVDVASLGDGDVQLVGEGLVRGKGGGAMPPLAATLVSVSDPNNDGTGAVTATYRVAAPERAWGLADRGRYQIEVRPEQVSDRDGLHVLASTVGQVDLEVIRPGPSPRVKGIKLTVGKNKPHAVSVKFSADVSASLRATSLSLANIDGASPAPEAATVSWNPKSKTATWAFGGTGFLPAGKYRVTLRAAEVVDAAGRHLDGDRDGAGGDDHATARPLRVK